MITGTVPDNAYYRLLRSYYPSFHFRLPSKVHSAIFVLKIRIISTMLQSHHLQLSEIVFIAYYSFSTVFHLCVYFIPNFSSCQHLIYYLLLKCNILSFLRNSDVCLPFIHLNLITIFIKILRWRIVRQFSPIHVDTFSLRKIISI